MNNLKVRTKMLILMASVLFMVVFSAWFSSYNMKKMQTEALTELETKTRTDYDSNIKEQVETVISLLTNIDGRYESGELTMDEAKKLQKQFM